MAFHARETTMSAYLNSMRTYCKTTLQLIGSTVKTRLDINFKQFMVRDHNRVIKIKSQKSLKLHVYQMLDQHMGEHVGSLVGDLPVNRLMIISGEAQTMLNFVKNLV